MFLKSPKHFLFILSFLILVGCFQRSTKSEHIIAVDDYYLNRQFAQALDTIRPRTLKADDKDKLLYLMEAGSILHTMKEWEKSNLVFEEANEIADNISKSFSKELAAFFINDTKNSYKGESFERVKIKLYIALNYLMLNDHEKSRRFFRLLNQELKDIRDLDQDYKQNQAARYLNAILAESMGDYNDARVQYNNMLLSEQFIDVAKQGLFVLANLEKDREDLKKFKKWSDLPAYDSNLNQINYDKELGSLVVIHESGLAPIKTSRGRLGDDEVFQTFLAGTIATAVATEGHVGVDETALLAMVANGENPIPIYTPRKEKNVIMTPTFSISNLSFQPISMDNYTATALRNFNDNYPKYVQRNVFSIVTKVLTVFVAKTVVKSTQKDEDLGDLLGILVSFVGGGIVSSTLAPDLRTWNLTYDNLQIKRIWLPPGQYSLNISSPQSVNYLSDTSEPVSIESGKTSFVLLKSF